MPKQRIIEVYWHQSQHNMTNAPSWWWIRKDKGRLMVAVKH